MSTDAPDGRAGPIDVIFRSLDDSDWGRRHLPRLVSLLSHERSRVRIGAGWAICYVAEEHPDSAAYLVRRLGDRLTDDEVALTVEQAFLGVAARYPDVVDEELPEVMGTDTRRQFERNVGGSMLRADYTGGGGNRNSDVGRVRMPRGGDEGDGRQVYTDDGDDERWRLHRWDDDDGDGGAGGGGEGGRGDGEDGGGEGEASHGEVGNAGTDADDAARGRSGGRPARELWAKTDHLATIAADCRFDDLAVMSGRRRGRYADRYRTRADLDDEEFAVSLVLFHRPDEERRSEFVDELEETLALWHLVDDVEGVRTVYDWGPTPRPWALVEYADKDLGERRRFTVDEALWNARHLAASLAHAHENGVVHAGVDPGNVSYHENLLDPEERQIPMVHNVGLLSVVRRHFDPTGKLDPRYAAPEYFDRGYGRIDHATDIYGLGALCFHLFTGRPPYHGDYASIREAVLSPTTPTPSDVATVPDGLDEIVGKAMATEKFNRYEGVTHMAADLRAMAKRDGIGRIYEAYPTASSGADADAESDAGASEAARATVPDERATDDRPESVAVSDADSDATADGGERPDDRSHDSADEIVDGAGDDADGGDDDDGDQKDAGDQDTAGDQDDDEDGVADGPADGDGAGGQESTEDDS